MRLLARVLLLLEAAEARLHLGQPGARPLPDAVLAVVELALLLGDEALAGRDRLAARGELVAGAEEQLLGVAQLREARLDLREPLGVRLGRRLRSTGTGDASRMVTPRSRGVELELARSRGAARARSRARRAARSRCERPARARDAVLRRSRGVGGAVRGHRVAPARRRLSASASA